MTDLPLGRMITTDMSAGIVSMLRRQNWTVQQIAATIAAPVEFVELVRSRKQVFTWSDLKKIGKKTNQSAELVFLNAIEARSGNEPLLAGMRQLLEAMATPLPRRRKTASRRRATRTRAA